MKKITAKETLHLEEAVSHFLKAKKAVTLTGAGISVESGIDDFRSPGGLWSKYSPEEYATLQVFRKDPGKAWELFRALGKGLVGKKPNAAHLALAELERKGTICGIVTQNIDNLHQAGGSRNVLEIHGDYMHLQCLGCGYIGKTENMVVECAKPPVCEICGTVLKPNVVLFGEGVRKMDEIQSVLNGCDLLLIIGTSAQVYPAAYFPDQVKAAGGLLYEFNKTETVLSDQRVSGSVLSDYFFHGSASTMLTIFHDMVVDKLAQH